MSWLLTFCGCSTIDFYANKFLSIKKSNLIACMLFQLFFVTNSFYIRNGSELECKSNLELLYGYFLYDTLYIYFNYENRISLFLFHHIGSLYLLNYTLTNPIPNTHYATMLVLIAELHSPFINIKEFIKNNVVLKELNKKILYYFYIICRLTLFPIYITLYIWSFEVIKLRMVILGIGFYTMSFVWFLEMKKKFKM
jgi:hypothetical protein